MIKIALIGTGAVSEFHLTSYRKLQDRCQLVAICDIAPGKAQKYAVDNKLDVAIYENHSELLEKEKDVDLVAICTPPGTHSYLAIDFLLAGKHVIVEKPMATSLEECDSMLAAAKKGGGVFASVAQNRFTDPVHKLKKILDSGLAGRILHAQVNSLWWRGYAYYDLWWRGAWETEGGGCTLNHAVHQVDQFLWMMGKPTNVFAMMANTNHDNAEVEDLSIAVLSYGGEKLAQITSSVIHHDLHEWLTFQGTEAKVSFPFHPKALKAAPNGFPQENKELADKLQQFYDDIPNLTYGGHTGQIEHVLTAIETGAPVITGGQEGRNTVELISAIYQSASLGTIVQLPMTPADPFYTKQGILENATHFYEKKNKLDGFSENKITV